MNLKLSAGEALLIKGNRHDVNNIMHQLSVGLQKKGKVLFIDTLNSINPYNSIFHASSQADLFKNIYCVRTEKPYDLLARIKTTGSFIRKNSIKILLVNSLTNFWEDSEEDEIIPTLNNILNEIRQLTKEHNLITVVGNCQSDDKNEIMAINELSKVV